MTAARRGGGEGGGRASCPRARCRRCPSARRRGRRARRAPAAPRRAARARRGEDVNEAIRPASLAGRAAPAPRRAGAACSSAPANEDDQPLDDHDHVAGELRHVEGELGAALVERAEQDRRQHDADRMDAAHQRHGDADEAGAAEEVEQQTMLHAHDLVERHQARQRARDRHGHDHHAGPADAGIHGGRLVVAEGAELVAQPRVPDRARHGQRRRASSETRG